MQKVETRSPSCQSSNPRWILRRNSSQEKEHPR